MKGAHTATGILLMAPMFLSLASAGFLPGYWTLDRIVPPTPSVNKFLIVTPWANERTSQYMGHRGYQQYHANDSLIGRPVLCSPQEKMCFRINMLYDKILGCVNLTQRYAKFSAGHLVPVSFEDYDDEDFDYCDGYVMAFDDRCYRKEVVREDICGCDAEPTRHFLHGVECRCVPPVPIHVTQPNEEGKCRIPDLRFPDVESSFYYQSPYERIQGFTSNQHTLNVTHPAPQFHCSAEQERCFSQGKVWVRQLRACFPLLERGPCTFEHVVALNGQAAKEGHVEARCVHVRGNCPPGQVRMLLDGHCYNEEDIKSVLNGRLLMNQFGVLLGISNNIRSLQFRPSEFVGRQSMCIVRVDPIYMSRETPDRVEEDVSSNEDPDEMVFKLPEGRDLQKLNLESKSLCANESDIIFPESSEPCECVYVPYDEQTFSEIPSGDVNEKKICSS